MGKLTAASIKAAKRPGRYGDGNGLYLMVGKSGSRSWIVRVQKTGKRRDIGLGSAKKVSLAMARERAELARSQMEAGLDPVGERKKAEGIPTFRLAAELVYAERHKSWRNGKHQWQWIRSLEMFAFPAIGDLPVNAVSGPAVRDLLADIWLEKNETARRVRQRIDAVIDWAVGKGYRDGPLPMAIINRSLPKVTGNRGHHKAMPFTDVPKFMGDLRERETIGRTALEALILTAARSGEIRLATWSEIDFDEQLWTIPASRMKAGREHVVPLSKAALSVFERMREWRTEGSEFVFPGAKRGKPLSDMTLTKAMRDMGRDETPHGFRSSFKDWAAETTSFANELSEAALAHAIKDKTEAAYRRGNLLEKRRDMMEAWAEFCSGLASIKIFKIAS